MIPNFFEDLLDDKNISEIIVLSYNQIAFEKDHQLHLLNTAFDSNEDYNIFLQYFYNQIGMELNFNEAFIHTRWREFRLQLSFTEDLKSKVQICMRRLRFEALELEQLEEKKWLQKEQKIFLNNLIKEKKNILIVGATASGKTTLLNSLIQSCENNCRCIILEDTAELCLPNAISSRMISRTQYDSQLRNYDLSHLLKESLRMRPDRLIVGEVRGTEAKDLLMAMATGHQGSMGSMHASSAQEALLRLEMLVQMGAKEWNSQSIKKLIYLSIEYILVMQKIKGKNPELKSIHKIQSYEDFGISLDCIYEIKNG